MKKSYLLGCIILMFSTQLWAKRTDKCPDRLEEFTCNNVKNIPYHNRIKLTALLKGVKSYYAYVKFYEDHWGQMKGIHCSIDGNYIQTLNIQEFAGYQAPNKLYVEPTVMNREFGLVSERRDQRSLRDFSDEPHRPCSSENDTLSEKPDSFLWNMKGVLLDIPKR